MYKTNINLNIYKTFYDVTQYGFKSQPVISSMNFVKFGEKSYLEALNELKQRIKKGE